MVDDGVAARAVSPDAVVMLHRSPTGDDAHAGLIPTERDASNLLIWRRYLNAPH